MAEKNIITKEGLAELKAELKNLIEIERPRVIEDIKEARNQGDLSENAEFDAAREKQGVIEDRISEIESIINNSTVITSSKSNTRVRIGSEVVISDVKAKTKETYQIVGTLEADPLSGKISNVSPIGSSILNKEEGDVVTVSFETKNAVVKIDYKIISVKNN